MIKKKTYLITPITSNFDNSEIGNLCVTIHEKPEQQMYLIHRALIQQLNEYRTRNANTKTRAQVRGGGKKPWKQKGTGRARVGSTRSPLWKGGGVIFGPQNKIYKSKINKKEKNLAIKTLIYNKFKKTIIINQILDKLQKPSTKLAVKELKYSSNNIYNCYTKTLLIIAQNNPLIYLSLRNLPNLELITVNNLNILSLIQAEQILITSDALKKIYDKYND
uniref:Large ribosomal subunit protein uL4c n=1 Tax=Dipterocladia arabiensis TaxID=2007176 RepID=A0A1Z1M0K9_9FLOR|nr:ribosomal protein L4 [Dipterocladia arabiensis]ARW59422.1 ribosomal protein L4 [Dipterocladia arabiensis]